MAEKKRRSDRVEMAIPIRVRGMSKQTKFFDEDTETRLISNHGLMTRLRSLVDLETEIHVTSLKNNRAGNFRVTWVQTRGRDGFHDVGLELVDSDGDLWEVHFPAAEPGEDEVTAQAWLECQRCRQKLLMTVPEAEYEYLSDGFLIAKPCERCKATTPWEFSAESEAGSAAEAEEVIRWHPTAPAFEDTKKGVREDLRNRGRAPLKMQIKVMRHKYGTQLEDVCETLNISRNGAYFLTSQNYDVGERVKVILPYKEGDVVIPVPARVVRQDQPKGTYLHAIALQLEGAMK